jgi:very-short-patch-repair endonuclease
MARHNKLMSWAPRIGEERRKDSRAARRARELRSRETSNEHRLWKLQRLLNREGANFRRQAHVGGLVYDFADLRRKLLVELNGGVHERLADVIARDAEKSQRAEALGYQLARIANRDVWSAPDRVVDLLRPVIDA